MHISPARAIAIGVAFVACTSCSGDPTATAGSGLLDLQLTDAPFSSDSVSRVDIFVVRIDAKTAAADSAEVADGASDDAASAKGWTTLATPNKKIELLALRNGTTTPLGTPALPAGAYQSFRFVIDPSQSTVTLKNGTVLSTTSSPSVSFPSGARSGIKLTLSQAVTVASGGTTKMVIDFDVDQSFVMRGNSLAQNGLLFKPVIRGTVK